ncbi:MAG: MBL fold metallo-hydrolase [Desulfobacteraceae bacterium]|nr:MAG: MBL fold metallo-hydrolase [Desulfobacteraceae bacterium]
MSYIIHPIVTAQLAVETGRITYLRNYGKLMWIPCPFYLITGGSEPILVDTSGHADVMSRLRHEPVKPVMNFEKALQSFGLDLEDIRIVIHTHLMYDHCANSKLLPKAEFVVQRKELDFALDPHPMFAGAYQRNLFEGLSFQIADGDQELLPGIKLFFDSGTQPRGAVSCCFNKRRGSDHNRLLLYQR